MAQGKLHTPTDESRRMVKALAAVGIRHEDIADKIDISSDTLVKHYKRELNDGRVDANSAVARSLYEQAKTGNTTAMIFWLKTRAGWKETDRHEITGADGSSLVVKWQNDT